LLSHPTLFTPAAVVAQVHTIQLSPSLPSNTTRLDRVGDCWPPIALYIKIACPPPPLLALLPHCSRQAFSIRDIIAAKSTDSRHPKYFLQRNRSLRTSQLESLVFEHLTNYLAGEVPLINKNVDLPPPRLRPRLRHTHRPRFTYRSLPRRRRSRPTPSLSAKLRHM
jgi:hypothetical protein